MATTSLEGKALLSQREMFDNLLQNNAEKEKTSISAF